MDTRNKSWNNFIVHVVFSYPILFVLITIVVLTTSLRLMLITPRPSALRSYAVTAIGAIKAAVASNPAERRRSINREAIV